MIISSCLISRPLNTSSFYLRYSAFHTMKYKIRYKENKSADDQTVEIDFDSTLKGLMLKFLIINLYNDPAISFFQLPLQHQYFEVAEVNIVYTYLFVQFY